MVPFVATLVYSFTVGWTALVPSGWTTKYWMQAFTTASIWPAIGKGLLISIPPVLISNIVVVLALYTSVVHYDWLEKIIQMARAEPISFCCFISPVNIVVILTGSKGILVVTSRITVA